MDTLGQLGIYLIQQLQSFSPALDGVMKFFTFLGTIEFYLLFIPIIYWLVDAQLGIRVLLLLITTDFIGSACKQLGTQPRPYWIGGVKGMAVETSYGLPSTHASNSLAVWGYLAYRLKKGWLWALFFVLVTLIGLSRMYLGVHFPHDVLGGWLIGLIVLVLFIWGEKRVLPWLKTLTPIKQIGIGFGASVLMILVGMLILALISTRPDPAAWSQYASQARNLTNYITLSGALFGSVAGYVLMFDHARFLVKRSWGWRILAYLLGISGVIVFYILLDRLFGMLATDETILGYLLRYIRYCLVALWVAFGAPWIFLKLKLAEPAMKGASDEQPEVGITTSKSTGV